MKRVVIILSVFMLICMNGCIDQKSYYVSGQYVMEYETERPLFVSRLEFNDEEKTFMLEFDPLSSTVISGTYEIKSDTLYAETIDGKVYIFDIVDNHTLIFVQSCSAQISSKNEKLGIQIKDKTVFKKFAYISK